MKKSKIPHILIIAATILLCAVTLFPFVWMISTSFKPANEVYSYPPTFVPVEASISGYIEILTKNSSSFNFIKWTANSAVIAVFTTIFAMLIASLGGYGLSRFKFKCKGALTYTILTSQVLPGSLLIVPLYIIMSNLKLLDTHLGLILAYATFSVPFCTWMMKGFFDTIPASIDEAAMVDGANRFGLFTTIIIPLTAPGLVATGLFSFITGWNEYLFASVFMKNYKNWTLPVGIASFQGQYTTNWATIMAGSVLITLPVVVLFLLLQKHLVSGMTAGAVKQ
ncbi:multiple sugar transport system permease protein/raffinose/stachyose/melibiose transport system permease protein [Ruminiclostridium sufflavum DSM 19573]|uniref:Multiple sugar transport system permease protein/raffinose/stachyose/melibiose transport system permease protein n=1 Tax=Ruminiclostridium sufflavum DSM 19573 TaxID=1121337 RepID=A0A318XLX9_9FIRM|nr:carbohydrate ABC transporter permease [Ruminiclostridium sufflavum]PYG88722.1 multiple sugar transport system permease protein/raffinose/stachyose/melibiose transport system permease protein [Ruminiclostridium sufflavum DSM 19573]